MMAITHNKTTESRFSCLTIGFMNRSQVAATTGVSNG